MGFPAAGRKVSIWWDMESCPLPPNIHFESIARLISDVLLCTFRINGHVHQFSAYGNCDRVDERVKQTLASSAIRLRHVPPGMKERVEKTMLVDMFCWSMDESPPAILIFIVGNIDLSNAIHRLSQRTYGVCLVCYSAHQMAESMFAGVIEWVEWRVILHELLLSVDFNSSRNFHFPNFAYFNPTRVILTENNSFTTFRRSWPFVPTLDDSMSCITTNPFLHTSNCEYVEPCPPCHVPQEIYGQSESVCNSTRINQSRIKDFNNPVRSRASDFGKASMDDLKTWLIQFLKKHGRKGYPISRIYEEFTKATGKVLELKHLGFPKLVKLLEEFKDVALLKSLSPSVIYMFPIETGFEREWKPEDIHSDCDGKSKEKSRNDINTRKNEVPTIGCKRQSAETSSSEVITPEGRVLIKATLNSRVVTRKNGVIEYKRQSAETSSGEVITHEGRILIKATLNSRVVTRKNGGKAKASMQDLKMWLSSEVVNGSLRDGIEISSIYDKFKADTGKEIDLEHLGYSKLSKLLENFEDIVTLNKYANSVKLFATMNDTNLTVTQRASPVMQGERTTMKDKYLKGAMRALPAMQGDRALSTQKVWRAVKPFGDVTEGCVGSYEASCYSQEMEMKRSAAKVLIAEKYSRGYSESKSVYYWSKISEPGIKDGNNPAVLSTRNYPASDLGKASMDDIKSWLIQFLKKHSRKGYPISLISREFTKSTGKVLDLNHLGFPKLFKLLEEFKDVALLKSVSPSEIYMFPIQTGFEKEWKPEDIDSDSDAKSKEKSHNDINTRKNEVPTIGCKRQSAETSSSEVITPEGSVLIKATLNSRVVTRKNGAIEYKRHSAETSSSEVITREGRILIKAYTLNSRVVTAKYKVKAKACMHDLKMWLSSEVANGCFRDEIEISSIYKKFKMNTGKVIDLNHLGYSKLSQLLENFKDIVTLNKNASSVKLFATMKDTCLTGNKGESPVMQGERTTMKDTYLSTGSKRALPVMQGERIFAKVSTKKVWRAVKPFSDVTERCMHGRYRSVSCYSQEMDNKRTPASLLITENYCRGNSEKLAAVTQYSGRSDSKPAVTQNPGHSDCKNASTDLLKSWLLDLMDRKESRNGYPISRIYEDFRRSTGNDLDLNFFRFRKLSNLLQQFNDVGVFKRYDQDSQIKLFPVKPALQIVSRETNSAKEFGNRHLSAETNEISFDVTSCSQLPTSTNSEIMRKNLGESSRDISPVHPDHHSKTADEIFSSYEQTLPRESPVVAGVDMIVCSMSAGVGELMVTPTYISSQTAQQNQPFENEKMKKRQSHKIARRGCMHSCLQHFILYVYDCLIQKIPWRNG